MIVYRVEHKNTGVGPYSMANTLDNVPYDPPPPGRDYKLKGNGYKPSQLSDYWYRKTDGNPWDEPQGFRDAYMFGCSPEQFLAWFTHGNSDCLSHLDACGFQVRMYKVKTRYVLRGGHQVCFQQAKARCVGKVEVTITGGTLATLDDEGWQICGSLTPEDVKLTEVAHV